MCPLARWVKEIAALATAETCTLPTLNVSFLQKRKHSLEGANAAKNNYEYIIFLKYFRESFSIRKEETVELLSCFAVFQGQKILQRRSLVFVLWYYEQVIQPCSFSSVEMSGTYTILWQKFAAESCGRLGSR